jgi:hypothetical protein
MGWKGVNSFMPVIQYNNYVNKMIDIVVEFLERYDLDPNVISDYRSIVPLYVKQYGSYLTEPKTVKLKSDILGSEYITASDRYNHFPESPSDHFEFMYFGRRRNWHLNDLKLIY